MIPVHYRIDSSISDHLPLCECGWRGDPVPSKLGALAQLSRHQHRAHQDQADALGNARRRAGRRAGRF